MDRDPTRESMLTNVLVTILLAPFAFGFIIAACLAAGPAEAFRAFRRK